ncbi:hypothetical protein [Aureimonas sp. ME7]|uniref:hypothetical protein n=1 Tax=Aureimonas sp. ME7 TaxID=2744252 RepID=UPI0015F5034F|nr:hypothetical protein [Aureimonas sp. ME7]
MSFRIDQFWMLLRFGQVLDAVLIWLVVILVPAWFVWHSTRHPLAWRVLKLVLWATLLWLALVLVLAVALMAQAGYGGYAMGLFLLPLGVVFGLGRARRRWARMGETGEGLGATLFRLVPFPLFVSVALYFVLAELSLRGTEPLPFPFEMLGAASGGESFEPRIVASSGTIDTVFGLLRFVGYAALYFFFLSIPYVMGNLAAAVLLVLARLGWERPMRMRGEADDPALSKGIE